jgi:hypothetical protein
MTARLPGYQRGIEVAELVIAPLPNFARCTPNAAPGATAVLAG